MLLISTQILIAEKPLRDDAFKILMDSLPVQYDPDNIKFLLRFDELRIAYIMLKQNGMIREGKTYIHYQFDWQDDEWYLNASDYFDKLCKKYSIYPKYLKLYNGQTD
jgi:hypothetical protein